MILGPSGLKLVSARLMPQCLPLSVRPAPHHLHLNPPPVEPPPTPGSESHCSICFNKAPCSVGAALQAGFRLEGCRALWVERG